MPSREAIAREVERLRAYWPNMPVNDLALRGYVETLQGYTDDELRGGVTLILQDYDGAAAPKPKQLRDACGKVAKYRRADLTKAQEQVAGPDVYCPECKTRRLIDLLEFEGDTRPARAYPDCAPTCSRYRLTYTCKPVVRRERKAPVTGPQSLGVLLR